MVLRKFVFGVVLSHAKESNKNSNKSEIIEETSLFLSMFSDLDSDPDPDSFLFHSNSNSRLLLSLFNLSISSCTFLTRQTITFCSDKHLKLPDKTHKVGSRKRERKIEREKIDR